jgi:hypothetical protein
MERLTDPFFIVAVLFGTLAVPLVVLILWDTWQYHRVPSSRLPRRRSTLARRGTETATTEQPQPPA